MRRGDASGHRVESAPEVADLIVAARRHTSPEVAAGDGRDGGVQPPKGAREHDTEHDRHGAGENQSRKHRNEQTAHEIAPRGVDLSPRRAHDEPQPGGACQPHGAAVEATRRYHHLAAAEALQVAGGVYVGDCRRAKAGDDAAAIGAWRRIEDINPAYLPIVAERIVQAHGRLGRDETAIHLLQGYLEQRPSPDLLHLLFQTVMQRQGWAAARELAASELKRHPSLRALDDYLQASNAVLPEAAAGQLESRLTQDLVHAQVSQAAYYQCGDCGFKARQFFWQCPACARWESITPERREHE